MPSTPWLGQSGSDHLPSLEFVDMHIEGADNGAWLLCGLWSCICTQHHPASCRMPLEQWVLWLTFIDPDEWDDRCPSPAVLRPPWWVELHLQQSVLSLHISITTSCPFRGFLLYQSRSKSNPLAIWNCSNVESLQFQLRFLPSFPQT